MTFCAINPIVVIEFGRAYTKVGLGGEPEPRAIIATPQLQLRYSQSSSECSLRDMLVLTTLNVEEWSEILYRLFHVIYFQHLRVNPSDHAVYIIENDLVDLNFKKAATVLLFETFRIPHIQHISSSLTPLHLCGVTSGIVINIGYNETRILPVCFGLPVFQARLELPLGGRHVEDRLKDCLISDSKRTDVATVDLIEMIKKLSRSDVERMKIVACYVRVLLNDLELTEGKEESQESGFVSQQSVSYNNDAGQQFVVSAEARWIPSEIFFTETDQSPTTLSEGVTRVLEMCSVDVKATVIQNVLLCGGTSDMKGFKQRFALELWKAIQGHPTLGTPVLLKNLCMGNPRVPGFVRPWVGASLYAAVTSHIVMNPQINDTRQPYQSEDFFADWVVPKEMNVVEATTSNDMLKNATRGRENTSKSTDSLPCN